MAASVSGKNSAEPLVKHTVADFLRKEIASGGLRPGVRIVEGTWARKFGVAQGSIREAINLLAQDGFVTKTAGRSARVVNLSEENVEQIFELRASLEGLAARLIAQRGGEVGPVQEALHRMRQALENERPDDMLDADLNFHLELCRLSGNSYLMDHARKILLPLFAFARIRVISTGQGTSVWGKDIEAHQRMVDLIQEGQADVAEQYVRHTVARFGRSAYHSWERKPAPSNNGRARRRSTRRNEDEESAT